MNENYNDEGFKENETKKFIQALPDSKLIGMYKVTMKDNPNMVKFIVWLKAELKARNLSI